jgi:hypothetical protein
MLSKYFYKILHNQISIDIGLIGLALEGFTSHWMSAQLLASPLHLPRIAWLESKACNIA